MAKSDSIKTESIDILNLIVKGWAPATEKYRLGLQGIIIAVAALNQLEIRKQAISILERLVAARSYNAYLGILHHQHVM